MTILEWDEFRVDDRRMFAIQFKSGRRRYVPLDEVMAFITAPNIQVIDIVNLDTGRVVSKNVCTADEAKQRIDDSYSVKMA